MKKIKEGTMEIISFDEFIDIITNGRGEEIKKQLKKLEKRSSEKVATEENFLKQAEKTKKLEKKSS